MKIGVALAETHDAERDLGAELLNVGERHKADHDVFHLARTLSPWSERNVHALAGQAAR